MFINPEDGITANARKPVNHWDSIRKSEIIAAAAAAAEEEEEEISL